jgi:hypothetical protein
MLTLLFRDHRHGSSSEIRPDHTAEQSADYLFVMLSAAKECAF